MTINANRLLSRLAQLNKIGALPGGGVRRLALTDADKEARDLLVAWMKEEGLEVIIDQVGNTYGVRAGSSKTPALAIGSHLDTVSTGGYYDGTYGVLAGLEVISVFNENNIKTNRPLVLINFTNEEGNRFSPDMMGSLVVSKPDLLADVWLAEALDGSGATVKSELERIGYLGTVAFGSVAISHYLELHIEQGPVLETKQVNIGVVEKVQGIYWTEYILRGQAAHAGTTPLSLRKDAGITAARVNLFLRELAEEIPGQLGTIGLMEFYPNVINVVPERVRFVTDLRNPDGSRLSAAQKKLDLFVTDWCKTESIEVSRNEMVRLAPVDFSVEVLDRIAAACDQLKFSSTRMVSGAGHDAQMMAAVSKAAMIFVPSAGGISHNVKEHTDPEDLGRGAEVLLQTVLGILQE
ncbi:MAG: Zn-dependent hydrolase [Cytophagales bacterium]|nr:Zn-dependent hydrolase [Cytophagales bacterium]